MALGTLDGVKFGEENSGAFLATGQRKMEELGHFSQKYSCLSLVTACPVPHVTLSLCLVPLPHPPKAGGRTLTAP